MKVLQRQRLEFLVKRLLYRTIRTPLGAPNGEENVVLLGSPIYVALADMHVDAGLTTALQQWDELTSRSPELIAEASLDRQRCTQAHTPLD